MNDNVSFIIDRLEGEYAILEIREGEFSQMPKRLLPDAAKEGDVVIITVDKQETEQRKQRIEGLMDKLFVD